MTSQVQLPLPKDRAQLEPISSNGGRKISLFERQNFNEGSLFNFLSGQKDIVHDGKLFCVKKRAEKKCEFSSQWHFKSSLTLLPAMHYYMVLSQMRRMVPDCRTTYDN